MLNLIACSFLLFGWLDIDVESEHIARVVPILDCLQASINFRRIAPPNAVFSGIAGKIHIHSAFPVACQRIPRCSCPGDMFCKFGHIGSPSSAEEDEFRTTVGKCGRAGRSSSYRSTE